ncbi:putative transcriptional regulatory protein [Beauveria bassiana]|nr:putative transcriptional regulatory protein [Beauveria bassiana]
MMSAKNGKRAAVACDYCRTRKRKCDGVRPACNLCLETNHECYYKETKQERQEATAVLLQSIVERLETLEEAFCILPQRRTYTREALFDSDPSRPLGTAELSHNHFGPTQSSTSQSQQQLPHTGLHNEPAAAQVSHTSTAERQPIVATEAHFSPHWQVSRELVYHEGRGDLSPGVMVIPMWHSTTTDSLLQLPLIRELIGRYPSDFFLHIESRRPSPWLPWRSASTNSNELNTTDLFPLSPDDGDHALVDDFVNNVNSQYCILDVHEVLELRTLLHDARRTSGIQPPLLVHIRLYIILALGTISRKQRDFLTAGSKDYAPSIALCGQILLQEWMQYSGESVLLPQTLCLLALYYGYMCWPLISAKCLHMASTALQQFFVRQHNSERSAPPREYQVMLRTFWAIFLQECDLLAEYHLPRSGVEHIVEKLPFPDCGDPTDKNMIAWLANLSARRLLNRVHHVMYDTAQVQAADQADSLPKLTPLFSTASNDFTSTVELPRQEVTEELIRQLQAWYSLLPVDIRPQCNESSPSVHDALLLLRYNATGHIIYRPYLFHVCALPKHSNVRQATLDNAVKCLHHCREFLRLAPYRISTSCGSLESTIHG